MLCWWTFVLCAVLPTVSPRAAAAVDRSTPRQTVGGFLRAAEGQDLASARRFLDRRTRLPPETTWDDVIEGLEVALQLRMLLDLDDVSDVPEGDPADGEASERIGIIELDGVQLPITLERVRRGGDEVWLFSSHTLQALPELGAPPDSTNIFVRLTPKAWRERQMFGLWGWQWLGLAIATLLGLPAGYVLGRVVAGTARRVARRTPSRWDDAIIAETSSTLRFVFAWATFAIAIESLELPIVLKQWVDIVATTPLILATGWMLRSVVWAITGVYLERTQDDSELDKRGLRTQINILRRLSTVSVVLITGSLVLLQFDVVRSVGVSLLASAGVAGVVVGFAAKESMTNVIAGLQLSISQTVRLGDSVVIEGQWGMVDEVALTYVRIKLFDDRHLVVPVANMVNNSFENWSSPPDGLIGIIDFAVDPTMPIEALREEVERVARAHPHHDGRELKLQLLELDERRAWVRARVSADDVSNIFQMRCDVRESLMGFLQRYDDGRCLPHHRLERLEG